MQVQWARRPAHHTHRQATGATLGSTDTGLDLAGQSLASILPWLHSSLWRSASTKAVTLRPKIMVEPTTSAVYCIFQSSPMEGCAEIYWNMLKTRSFLYNDSPVVQRRLMYLLLIIWDHFGSFWMLLDLLIRFSVRDEKMSSRILDLMVWSDKYLLWINNQHQM